MQRKRSGEDERCREKERREQKRYRNSLQRIRALHRASMCDVPRGAGLHLLAGRRLDTLHSVKPPGTVTEDVFADLAGAEDALIVSQIYPLNLSSKSCSVFSSFSCRAAIVRSPRVRSRTPRTMSVVRRKPPVSASGKSIVTKSE